MKGMKFLGTKQPEAHTGLKGAFLGDSQFKRTLEDLFQLTFARRAEVIKIPPLTEKPPFYGLKNKSFQKSSISENSSFKKPKSQPGVSVSYRKQGD